LNEKRLLISVVKITVSFLGLMIVLTSVLTAANDNRLSPWVVYYASEASADAFSDYQLLVLDSDNHPPLQELKKPGKLILGYISLGEVESYRGYYSDVRREGILLDENPYWKGSYFVDVRSAFWFQMVIEQLIPRILQQGFDGIFMDTLDNPGHLENLDPVKYKGMRAAASRLVKSIRLYFPYIKIMMNRAYDLIDDVAPNIDMLLGESIYTDYSFEQQVYRLVETPLYERQVIKLRSALALNPKIGLYTLDYWNPEDATMLTRIYAIQRKNGFIPYVSTIKLDKIIKEPR